MGAKLYVGNLAYAVTDERLQQHFAQHGSVVSARVITDKFSGRSKGFGFVEMASEAGRGGLTIARSTAERVRRKRRSELGQTHPRR